MIEEMFLDSSRLVEYSNWSLELLSEMQVGVSRELRHFFWSGEEGTRIVRRRRSIWPDVASDRRDSRLSGTDSAQYQRPMIGHYFCHFVNSSDNVRAEGGPRVIGATKEGVWRALKFREFAGASAFTPR